MPAEEDGSGDAGSDEDDSDEPSEESSEESSEEEDEEEDEDEEEGEIEDEPLSLEWPDTRRKQATYLLLLPIVFPLWLTVPDVRNQVNIWTHISDQLWYFKCLNTTYLFCVMFNRNPENSLWAPFWALLCGLVSSPTSWCGGPIRLVTCVTSRD